MQDLASHWVEGEEPGFICVWRYDCTPATVAVGQPGLLLRDVGEAAAAVAAIQSEFPAVNVSLVIETEPSILTLDCDVPGQGRRVIPAAVSALVCFALWDLGCAFAGVLPLRFFAVGRF
mmetsp:Transcript_26297/g.42146  ORF Transcript_26297/g.42146 Transcript_26297/m.42146 type:complete len:119 (+) Transcript_26297:551-907(+)